MTLPILFSMDEFERLHGIAHTAAIQTGAKGDELDAAIAKILPGLIEQANRHFINAKLAESARSNLRLVTSNDGPA